MLVFCLNLTAALICFMTAAFFIGWAAYGAALLLLALGLANLGAAFKVSFRRTL